MDIQRAKDIALELMEVHGLIDKGWWFKYHNRKLSAGTCFYTLHCIALSKPITTHADEVDVRDTILHEIAHALCGAGHGHDDLWVRTAKSIGANGRRCFDEWSKPSTTLAFQTVAKYVGTCPNGHKSYKQRMPKREHSCAKCSPRFNRNYLFTYSLNNP